MNIGLVTPYFPDEETINSGLANHFATLAEALSNAGHEITVIHIRPRYGNETNAFEETITKNNTIILTYKVALSGTVHKLVKHKWAVTDFLIKIKCMLIAAKHLPHIQKKYKLDVIETSSYFSLCFFYLLTSPSLPIVTRVSTTFLQMLDSYYSFSSRLLKLIAAMEIKLIRKSRYLITHAHDHAKELENLYRIDAQRFHIIPHGINIPTQEELYCKNNSVLKILYVGRLEYRKGSDILMQTIPLVLRKTDRVIFQIIGLDAEGVYENKFKLENDSEILKKVTFSGQLNNISTYKAYAECDIFVAPSRYESFGLIYIEAMSYGKPVIGCRVGGVPEIIEDNFNGLFAEINDPVSLCNKIIELVNNDALRISMGENARITAISKFSKETLGVSSVAYYEKCINKSN